MFTEATVILSISGLLALSLVVFRFLKPKFPASLNLKIGDSGEHRSLSLPSHETIRREAVEDQNARLLAQISTQTSLLVAALQAAAERQGKDTAEWRTALLGLAEKALSAHKDALTLTTCQAESLVSRTLGHLEANEAEKSVRLEAERSMASEACQAAISALPLIFSSLFPSPSPSPSPCQPQNY